MITRRWAPVKPAPVRGRPRLTVTPPRYRAPQPSWSRALLPNPIRSWEGTVLASIPSATLLGVSGHPVTVEVHVGPGLPGYHIVGLPDTACRESRDRVRAAILSSELEWPSSKSVTVNLAPSGRRKTGAGLDLAIAMGILVASEQVPAGGRRRLRLRRRARPRRLPSSGPRGGAHGGRARPTWWWSCRSVRVPRPTVAAPVGVRVASTLNEVVAALTTHAAVARGPDPTLGCRPPDAARPGRCAGPARRPPGPRDRRRRRPPPADGRLARLGQDDARPASRRRPPAARSCRRAGGHDDPLGGRRGDAARRARDDATVPGAAPHQLRGRPGRRRLGHAATGRDQPRPRRRPLPRRARRVPAVACSTPCANRWRRASSGSPAPPATPSCRPASCSSRPPTRARAAGARPGPASATTWPGCGTCDACPGRSLDRFDLRVAVQRPAVDELLDPGGGEPSAVVAARVAAARRIALDRAGRLNADLARRSARPLGPAHGAGAGAAAGRDRAGPPDRARPAPDPAGGPHDRRPPPRHGRPRRRSRSTSSTSPSPCRCGPACGR